MIALPRRYLLSLPCEAQASWQVPVVMEQQPTAYGHGAPFPDAMGNPLGVLNPEPAVVGCDDRRATAQGDSESHRCPLVSCFTTVPLSPCWVAATTTRRLVAC
jgi:hypothetical protein